MATTTLAQVGINSDNSAPDPSAMLDVKSTSSGILPPRMTKTERDLITLPKAGLTIYNTTSNGFECYNGTAWYSTVHYIGENYGGGIVFYVCDNGQHGLIAATTDQSTGMQWYNGTSRVTGTVGDGLFAGIMNTTLIVATQMADNQVGNFAAKVCADYSVTMGGTAYGDWYLPSKYELHLLYLQRAVVGTFNGSYWSSTEFNITYAWFEDFLNPLQNVDIKNHNWYYVRAIRAF